MIAKAIKLLTFSDVHLGVRRLNADVMCSNLWEFIFPWLDKVNLVCIVGDLFDTAIGFHDECGAPIVAFINRFLRVCNERGITVRILRGTYSHDRTQPKMLEVLHDKYGFKNDLKYFDKISLEHIPEFDIRVLYVPDDVPFKTAVDAMAHIKELMRTVGWDYVDYAFVHGYFDFVLPKTDKMDKRMVYTEEMYSFVRRRIIVGHVHTPASTPSGMIYYNGSTDRLAQGEEESKGMLFTEDDHKGHVTTTFIKNDKATIFKTFDYSDIESDDHLVNRLREDIDALPSSRCSLFVRVIHPSPEVREALASFVEKTYPRVVFSHRSRKQKDAQDEYRERDMTDVSFDLGPAPTPQDIPMLVIQQLMETKKKFLITEQDVVGMLAELNA